MKKEFKNVAVQDVYNLLNMLEEKDKLFYLDVAEGTLIDSFCILNYENGLTIKELDKLCRYNTIVDQRELEKYKYIYILGTFKNCWESDYTVIFTESILDNHSEIFISEEEDWED